MSAKRSFDVRSGAKKERPGRVVARKRVRDRRPLKVRRREAFKRSITIFFVLVLLGIGAVLFLLWRPEIRIKHIDAGAAYDPQVLEALARSELAGTYYGVIPRDSFFFYPERAIRERILATYPSASAVTLRRDGFDTLAISTSERIQALLWCGTPDADVSVCYQADVEGFVFAPATVTESASSTPELEVFAELIPPEDMSAYPLRGQVQGVGLVPDILRFVRSVQALGVLVEQIAIRNDEADLYTPEGVRITYVIGAEDAAAQSAGAAFPTLNFKDGSLVYVDLRFPGKVYVRRTGE